MVHEAAASRLADLFSDNFKSYCNGASAKTVATSGSSIGVMLARRDR